MMRIRFNEILILLFMICSAPSFIQGEEIANSEEAIFAGGCFWCLEQDFDQVKGVISTTSGYIGGHKANPTYQEVLAGGTGHVEALKVIYNPQDVNYAKLLDVYWHNIDPTRNDGQFCDVGPQYRPLIFYMNDTQKKLAEEYKQRLVQERKIQPILVEIVPASTFYPAELDHQNYYRKNPLRYKLYRYNCGRDKRLKEIWGDPSG